MIISIGKFPLRIGIGSFFGLRVGFVCLVADVFRIDGVCLIKVSPSFLYHIVLTLVLGIVENTPFINRLGFCQ